MLKPVLTYQSNFINNDYILDNMMQSSSTLNTLNTSNSRYSSSFTGYNFGNDLLYRHKFGLPGRTVSIDLNTTANNKTGNTTHLEKDSLFVPIDSLYTIDQRADAPVNGYGTSVNVVYTEPFGTDQQLQVSYTGSYNKNKADKRTYNLDYLNQNYDLMDTILSNKFDNDYWTQKGGVGYRLKTGDLQFMATLNYQRSNLSSDQTFPKSLLVNYTFENFLPSAQINYKFTERANLRINYRTSTNAPSIQQLQDVIDNTNSSQLIAGNPELKQQYSHNLMARFSNIGDKFSNIIMGFVMVNYRPENITNSYTIAYRDTLINGSIFLPAGGQLIKPVNLSGYLNTVGFFTYGFPIGLISSNLNLNLGGNYTRTPSLVNNINNISNAYNVNLGFTLSSNISENLDFNFSTRENFNITKNSLRSSDNNNYNSFYTRFTCNWIIWEGFFVNADVTNQFYTGLTQQKNNIYTLANFSIGKKLFSNNNGEIRLTAFDAFNQNKSIQTNVSDYYVEYTQNDVLKQYFMLTFTYNLRSFVAPPKKEG
jgi:hypothetical protein